MISCRMILTRLCTIFTFVLSINAFAHDCEGALSETGRISISLGEVPVLRQYVLDLLNDQKARTRVLQFLRRALIKENPSVFNLTDELREKWNIPSRTVAFAYTDYKIPMASYDSQHKSANSQFAAEQKNSEKPLGVYISDRPVSPEWNDLMSLLHELSHVRFNAFLKENYKKICLRLPPSFAITIDDECHILDEYIDLAGEKFAFGMQYELLAQVYRQHFPDSVLRPNDLRLLNLPLRQRTVALGTAVARNYGYLAPQVRAAADLPLVQLLIGGPALKDIDQAVRLYTDPQRSLPTAEELPAALGIVQYMQYLYKPGATDFGHRMLSLICSSLSDLATLSNGPARVETVLKGASRLADQDPRMRAAYNQVRECTATKPAVDIYFVPETPLGALPIDVTSF